MEGSLSGRVLMLMIRVKRVTASFMETEKPENVDDFLSFFSMTMTHVRMTSCRKLLMMSFVTPEDNYNFICLVKEEKLREDESAWNVVSLFSCL